MSTASVTRFFHPSDSSFWWKGGMLVGISTLVGKNADHWCLISESLYYFFYDIGFRDATFSNALFKHYCGSRIL